MNQALRQNVTLMLHSNSKCYTLKKLSIEKTYVGNSKCYINVTLMLQLNENKRYFFPTIIITRNS